MNVCVANSHNCGAMSEDNNPDCDVSRDMNDRTSNDEDISKLLSHICALEIQNLKIQKCLSQLDKENLVLRASLLEEQNKLLVQKLILEKPDIAIHEKKTENEYGYVNIDFSSDMGLELDCFGLSEIQSLSDKYSKSRSATQALQLSDSFEGATVPMSVVPTRSRKSQSSRFSLANRLSLDWSDKNGTRPHTLSRPSFDEYKGPVRQSIDAAINSMRLSTNQPLVEVDVKCNFMEFCIVGVNRDILTGAKKPAFGDRQETSILDNYPEHKQPFIESIADFAFPQKALLHMTDSLRYAEILCEKNRDQYNVLQFSDSFGTPTYACCLVVTEAIPVHVKKNAKTIKGLCYMEYIERCVSIIKRFLRHALHNDIVIRRQVITNKEGKVVGYITQAVNLADVGKDVVDHQARMRLMEKEKKRGKFGSSISKIKDNVKTRLAKNQEGLDTSHTSIGASSDKKAWMNNKLHHKSKVKAKEVVGGVFDDVNDDDNESEEENTSVSAKTNGKASTLANGAKAFGQSVAGFGGSIVSQVKLPSRASSSSAAPQAVHGVKIPAKPMTKPSTISGGGAESTKKKGYQPSEWKYVVTQRAYCILSAKPMHAFLFQVFKINRHHAKHCDLSTCCFVYRFWKK